MRDYKLAVFIGRFQPFHNDHEQVIKYGLEIADKVLVIVGSSHAARSTKNPFSFRERETMIRLTFHKEQRVFIEGVRDYHYSMETWIANVQAVIDQHSTDGDSIALIGSYKDDSSHYLNCFPQYDLRLAETGKLHGERIRRILFDGAKNSHGHIMPDFEGKVKIDPYALARVNDLVPNASWTVINSFRATKEYADLAMESQFIEKYKELWETAPFPPTFVTTDAVVTCSGHVLVVERKIHPGKGLFALPGGFLRQNELVKQGCIRELREETSIKVDKLILESQIVNERVFDYPGRSLRGRTISHGFHIKLRDGHLPEVKGNDDAAKAFWMPLWDVSKFEEKFFEDHAHIIHYFVGASQ